MSPSRSRVGHLWMDVSVVFGDQCGVPQVLLLVFRTPTLAIRLCVPSLVNAGATQVGVSPLVRFVLKLAGTFQYKWLGARSALHGQGSSVLFSINLYALLLFQALSALRYPTLAARCAPGLKPTHRLDFATDHACFCWTHSIRRTVAVGSDDRLGLLRHCSLFGAGIATGVACLAVVRKPGQCDGLAARAAGTRFFCSRRRHVGGRRVCNCLSVLGKIRTHFFPTDGAFSSHGPCTFLSPPYTHRPSPTRPSDVPL